LDFSRVWAAQAVPVPFVRQLDAISEVMAQVLRSPPQAGQTISEWAQQQACRQQALQMPVGVVAGFDDFVVGRDEVRAATREGCQEGRINDGLARVTGVIELGAPFWQAVERFALGKRLVTADDRKLPAMSWRPCRWLYTSRRGRCRGGHSVLEDRPAACSAPAWMRSLSRGPQR
jgi:hypothetical protein